MDLATMRDRFAKHTSSLSKDLSPAEIDEYLNRAYQFTVPLDITGEFTEGTYKFYATIGQREYTQPAHVVSLDTSAQGWVSGVWSGGVETIETVRWVWIETDPVVFESRAAGRFDSPGIPHRVLIYGKQIKFDSPPDQNYVMNFPGRLGPAEALTDEGIAHGIHAMAVVTAAAVEYLTEVEDTEGIAREGGNYIRYRSQLDTYSQARPNRRRWRRSF